MTVEVHVDAGYASSHQFLTRKGHVWGVGSLRGPGHVTGVLTPGAEHHAMPWATAQGAGTSLQRDLGNQHGPSLKET